MRTALAVAIGVVAMVCGIAAQAPQEQERPTIRTDEKVTMIFTNAEVIDVLQFIDKQTELEIEIAEDVTTRTEISLRVRDANLADVFKFVVEQAGLDYEVLDDKRVRVILKR